MTLLDAARIPSQRRTGRPGVVVLLCLLLCSLPELLLARTIAVPGQYPSIKGAMIAARAGDIILVSCGTYHESDIQVKPGVSLWSGTLQPDCAVIDAGDNGRCLVFTRADSTTNVVGFTLSGGRAPAQGSRTGGGAVLCEDSRPRIDKCVFRNNAATDGGALAAVGTGGPSLSACRFEGNRAQRHGGAVFWSASGGRLAHCVLTDNLALSGGGALAGLAGQLAVKGCLLRDNSAGNLGGAIAIDGTRLELSESVLAGNNGGLAGGAMALTRAAPVITGCTLVGNDADGAGTALYLKNATPTFERCLFTGSPYPLADLDDSETVIKRSNIYAAATPGWPEALARHAPQSGNISADPRYCSAADGDYHLRPTSPCLADAAGFPIGALGQGCGAPFPPDVVE